MMKVLSLWQPYLAGVLQGDGWLGSSGLGLRVIDEDFAVTFADALHEGFKTPTRPRKDERGYWLVRIARRLERFAYLLAFEPNTNAEKAAWLRGFFDSEGNVNMGRSPSARSAMAIHRRVAMFSTDEARLRRAAEYCQALGIGTRMQAWKLTPGHLGTKPVTALVVRDRKSIAAFARDVGSSIKRKQMTLDAIVAHYGDVEDRWRQAQAKGVATRNARRAAGGQY